MIMYKDQSVVEEMMDIKNVNLLVEHLIKNKKVLIENISKFDQKEPENETIEQIINKTENELYFKKQNINSFQYNEDSTLILSEIDKVQSTITTSLDLEERRVIKLRICVNNPKSFCLGIYYFFFLI